MCKWGGGSYFIVRYLGTCHQQRYTVLDFLSDKGYNIETQDFDDFGLGKAKKLHLPKKAPTNAIFDKNLVLPRKSFSLKLA